MQFFTDRIRQTSKSGLYLTYGIDAGKFCWQYIKVDKLKTKIFEESIRKNANINMDDFGAIIISGWGKEPPELVKQRIEQFGADYKAEEDAELQAYYESRSQVFFITASSDGRPCYYYVAVNGRIVDEFTRLLPSGKMNLSDFGNIIESGWGLPSTTTCAYMKEKYGIETVINKGEEYA